MAPACISQGSWKITFELPSTLAEDLFSPEEHYVVPEEFKSGGLHFWWYIKAVVRQEMMQELATPPPVPARGTPALTMTTATIPASTMSTVTTPASPTTSTAATQTPSELVQVAPVTRKQKRKSAHSSAPYDKDQLKPDNMGESSSDKDAGESPSKEDKGKDPSKANQGESPS
ncbi:hypothetical protein llap_8164 [Limosa lapponica baueri]|uniref:Uncharacterized protein n=1 Tax=Limosa lapponica baueri TaxID=1758121 RepID=A0A2I0U619_LIMLA|nr:hypothetical protein llap_8164 [Limosa lapponica baueri]